MSDLTSITFNVRDTAPNELVGLSQFYPAPDGVGGELTLSTGAALTLLRSGMASADAFVQEAEAEDSKHDADVWRAFGDALRAVYVSLT